MQKTLSVKEACAALSIGKTSFYKLLGKGELNAVRLGGRTLITWTELERLITSLPKAETETRIRLFVRSGSRS